MIVVSTPLRISLLGGGTDLEDYYRENHGAVLSTAIDKNVYVVVKERFDNMIYINYSKKEIVGKVADIKHDIVRNAMLITGVGKGIEITTLSDIPSEGSGLGSSSSIAVALLHALYAYKGELVTAEQLAQEACHIEIEMMGKPIGKQDQYISAYGGMRFIRFYKDRTDVETVNISDWNKQKLSENLLLFYTGITRSADVILGEQKENIPDKIEFLNKLRGLAYKGREYLEKKRFDGLGELLDEAWQYKKQLANGVTNKVIDATYEKAINAGAIGGKICGGGGGGFLLLYCPHDKKESVRKALMHLREMPFAFSNEGSRVIFNARR